MALVITNELKLSGDKELKMFVKIGFPLIQETRGRTQTELISLNIWQIVTEVARLLWGLYWNTISGISSQLIYYEQFLRRNRIPFRILNCSKMKV